MHGVSWGIFGDFWKVFEIFLDLEANSWFFVAPEEPGGDFPDLAWDFGLKVYRDSGSFRPGAGSRIYSCGQANTENFVQPERQNLGL